MNPKEHFDIAIIGSGVTGLSAAYHLAKTPNLRLALSEDSENGGATESSGNMIAGGFIDNFTRVSQRHGLEAARTAWLYSDHAFEETLAFAGEHQIECVRGQRVRLVETEDERIECEKAVKQLRGAGFHSELRMNPKPGQLLIAEQIDEPRAAFLRKHDFLQLLKNATHRTQRLPKTLALGRSSQHYELRTAEGLYTAEVVILANHLGICDLMPSLKPVLVSSQDQCQRMRTAPGTEPFPYAPGTLLTWRHGHYWAHIEGPEQVALGGARFFRPLAGFEAEQPEIHKKVTEHLPEAWAALFPKHPLTTLVEIKPGLDIRPCDELPVVGPMFGESGLFVGAGYMGLGLSLGFKAGQSLARIVLGKTDELPRLLWPERHRSLME